MSSPRSAYPLLQAKKQLQTAEVWIRDSGGRSMSMRSVKGWGVMSRWATEDNKRDPLLYALDPASEGGEITEEERKDVIRDVARAHMGFLLYGMGLSQLAPKVYPLLSPDDWEFLRKALDIPSEEVDRLQRKSREERSPLLPAELTSLAVDPLRDRRFVGAVINAAGAVIPGRVSALIAARSTMPAGLLQSLYFVGLSQSSLEAAIEVEGAGLPEEAEFVKVPLGAGMPVMMDTDGFIFAPLFALSESGSYELP